MKIAFICEFDSNDPNERSGVPYFIAKSFEELGHEVIRIGPFVNHRRLTNRIWNGLLSTFYNKILKGKLGHINNQWSKEFLSNYARQAEEQLLKIQYDIVFSPESHTIAYLNQSKPVIFWRDATFKNLLNYYEAYSNMAKKSIQEGHASEREALKRTSLAVYTSQWAADSAIKDYGASPSKVTVIERGANLSITPSVQDVEANLVHKIKDPILRILFIGSDWKRKGGDITYKTVKLLNEKGIKCELYSIGGKVETNGSEPEWLHYEGYIKKNSKEGQQQLKSLYEICHFFMMPSEAENFGIVYAEANAYGLPCLAKDTGGVSSAIHQGENGVLFPTMAGPQEFCDYLIEVWQQRDIYVKLVQGARDAYQKRLNWHVNTGRLLQKLNTVQK